MPPAATWIFLAMLFSGEAFAQVTFHWPPQSPASPGWPSGPPHSRVSQEGILAHSDGELLSLELQDQRVIRFLLDGQTHYRSEVASEKLSDFYVTDVVKVDAEVDSKGFLVARSVRFIRKATPNEQAEILQSPELMQRWHTSVLRDRNLDTARDDRRLNLVTKPKPINDHGEEPGSLASAASLLPASSRETEASRPGEGDDELIASIRRAVNEAFDKLPNLRAKQVTSLFHSTSRPVKWIPDNVVSAEIAYEEEKEAYSDIQIDGKRPANAPMTGDSEYMRSLDKAWSTGDFETLSHCVFSELEDRDFHRARNERSEQPDLLVYEFNGGRSSACLGIRYKSEIAYPAYKGSITVSQRTREVLHVELEAVDIPTAFPLDRAERSVDFARVRIGGEQLLLPATGYWFGCFRNSYSCFMNRIDFRDYRRFEAASTVKFGN